MSSDTHDTSDTPKRGLSRRHLLGASAVAAVGAATLSNSPVGTTPAEAQNFGAGATFTARKRPSATYLFSNGQQMQSLRRGVQVMKSRPFEDPTSWTYQAAIHGYGFAPPAGLPQGMIDNMSNCIHGVRGADFPNRYFLPWHRLYLYYFERILRDASGDDTLMLPYWNYSDPGGRSIPLGFRWPADSSNALYNPNRNQSQGSFFNGFFQPPLFINRGDPLPANRADSGAALGAFGFDNFSDTLEGGLHGTVHVDVGGQGGDMSGFNTAGLDAIFWLHHCNVDRLWSRWLDRFGNANPGSGEWWDRQFSFYDETGTRVDRFVGETADTDTLGYGYDDDPAPFVGFQPFIVASLGESGGIEEELATAGAAVTLGGGRSKVAIAPVDAEEAESAGADLFFTETDAQDPRPVILRLQGINYEGAPGYLYEIYVNMPDGTPREEAAPYYAGTLAPFGLAESIIPRDIDISGLLNRQIDAELFLGGQVTVDFIPAGVAEGADAPEITVAALSLVRP